MPQIVITEPILVRRHHLLVRLGRIDAALDRPLRKRGLSRRGLRSLRSMLREEVGRLEAEWLEQGPGLN